MKRIARYLLIATIPLGIKASWQYRVHMAVVTASQFAPRVAMPKLVPAGTEIRAILKNEITESTKPGDLVLGFVSDQVIVNGKVAIPPGTRVNGTIEQISKHDNEATIWLSLTSLVIEHQEIRIHTRPVLAKAPIVTDISILGSAFDAVTEGGIGAAFGATTRSQEAIAAGLAAGALRGASGLDQNNIQITLVLSEPVVLLT